MIVNVKSLMAALMATIIVLAVVIPIAGAMVDLSAQKVYEENSLAEGEYLMSEMQGTKNPRLAVIDHDDGVQLSIAGEREPVTTRSVIFSDTFVTEFYSGYFKVYYNEAGTSGYYTSSNGDYFAMDKGYWTIYKFEDDSDPTPGGESSQTKELLDDESKATLLDRVPAINKQLFTESELLTMAREGADILRAASAYKTGHYSWIVYPDSEEGDLYYAIGGNDVYVDSGSTIYTAGASTGTDGRAVLKGTLDHMAVVHSYFEVDPANITCHYTASGFTNVLDDITFTDAGSPDPYTVTHFVVPLKYTADKDVGMAGTLVSLVPVVLIVGVIIGVVSLMIVRRAGADEI